LINIEEVIEKYYIDLKILPATEIGVLKIMVYGENFSHKDLPLLGLFNLFLTHYSFLRANETMLFYYQIYTSL